MSKTVTATLKYTPMEDIHRACLKSLKNGKLMTDDGIWLDSRGIAGGIYVWKNQRCRIPAPADHETRVYDPGLPSFVHHPHHHCLATLPEY